MEFSQRRRVEFSNDPTPRLGHKGRLAGPSMRGVRKPRHSGIFQAIHRMDAQLDPASRAALARWVRDQYESEFGDVPVGFVARCYLGPPYVDHRLDLFQSIVDHYAPADAMPEPFAGARMLARNEAYEFVEIYASGEMRPVRADGTAVA